MLTLGDLGAVEGGEMTGSGGRREPFRPPAFSASAFFKASYVLLIFAPQTYILSYRHPALRYGNAAYVISRFKVFQAADFHSV